MKKAKAEITITITYEIDPKLYPKGYSPEECLAMDIKEFINDPGMILMIDDLKGSEINWKGRIIDINA